MSFWLRSSLLELSFRLLSLPIRSRSSSLAFHSLFASSNSPTLFARSPFSRVFLDSNLAIRTFRTFLLLFIHHIYILKIIVILIDFGGKRGEIKGEKLFKFQFDLIWQDLLLIFPFKFFLNFYLHFELRKPRVNKKLF